MLHKLAIITVVYENYTVLADFLASLKQQTNKNFTLFCVDVSIHRNTINHSHITAKIIQAENRGYAYGVNIGIKKAIEDGFEYFCVINNDVYFKEEFIANAIKSIRQHPLSIIGGKIYYAYGFEYHKDRYKKNELGKIIWYAGGSIDWNHALTPHRGVDEVDKGQFDKIAEIDFVNGALMLFDKSVVENVGYWNEDYFLYFEDADYCALAKKSGIKLFYDPSVVIWHKNSQSTGGSGSKLHQKYQYKNRLKFGLKYAPIRTKLHLIKNYIIESIK